ncbi:MAG TPA: MFS transporter [Polyangia bacterium]|nr:MFS transporter [Polyangia bacterium]
MTARHTLSKPAAFRLQASIILFFLASSSAPTPLWSVYQAAWGFSPVTVTIVFGIYAVAVLAALLVVGSLSDYVGRRPVLLAATLLQATAMAMFATAQGVWTLLLARVVQGLATGAAVGAVGAGLLDIDRDKGTIANAVTPMLGTATGGVLSALLAQFLPWPTTLVYVVLGTIFLAQAAGVVLMPESAARRPGAARSLRPHIRLPPAVRGAALIAAPALVATWSLVGFYAALGPAVARRLMGSSSLLVGGLLLFVMAGSGALTVLVSRARPARAVLLFGSGALIAGVALSLAGITGGSPLLFFAGAMIAGAGFGAGFQGALRTVLPLAAASERAGVLSLLYMIAYLSMGVPVVFAGLRVVHGGGLFTASREYGVAVIALAAAALLGTLVRRPAAAPVAVLAPARR